MLCVEGEGCHDLRRGEAVVLGKPGEGDFVSGPCALAMTPPSIDLDSYGMAVPRLGPGTGPETRWGEMGR